MLAIDLFCGLGGWTEGLLSEGFEVVGFDIERHDYGTGSYPAQLVLQDVLTLHGSQFRNAACIVASPPCQAYSYRTMPWNPLWEENSEMDDDGAPPINHRVPDPIFNTLFEACFRIQREACAAAGRHIPLVVENVRGAQKWVGRAKWHFGSYFLWGDVPALMPITLKRSVMKAGIAHRSNGATNFHGHTKVAGLDWSKHGTPGYKAQGFNVTAAQRFREGIKSQPVSEQEKTGLSKGARFWPGDITRRAWSKSDSRKAASAQIAKIPFPLAQHIARCFKQAESKSH